MNIRQHTSIERHDVAEACTVGLESTDDALLGALQNADDTPLDAAIRVPLDPRDDTVAVHRVHHLSSRDVNIGPASSSVEGLLGASSQSRRAIRNDETETGRIGLQPADDEIHLVGESEPIAPNL